VIGSRIYIRFYELFMYPLANSICTIDLKSAIIPNPLVVSADASVMDAIALAKSAQPDLILWTSKCQ
jgi:hypothetical protein